MIHGLNVTRVEPNRVFLEDGSVLACDIAVWSAGLEAPPAIRALPVAHGKGGRIAVDPTLEVPGFPGVFAVGDVVEFRDPTTGMYVPGTAQAALAEARVAAVNVVARAHGDPMSRFTYRERGVVVALGLGQAAGSLRRVTIWGSPAALLKHAVEWEYSRAVEKGETPSLDLASPHGIPAGHPRPPGGTPGPLSIPNGRQWDPSREEAPMGGQGPHRPFVRG